MILNDEEKTAILVLVTATIILIFVILYLTGTKPKEHMRVTGNVHIIYTSGDIEPTFQKNYNATIKDMSQFDVNVYDPPHNPSNIVPDDWNKIAQDIAHAYNKYDAIVVVCGRDTLAYTASALSFMIENLSKPIVLTDGNVYKTLKLVLKTRMCEVMVSSGNKLLRGCRVIPYGSESFTSPTYPNLGKNTCLKPPTEKMQIMFMNPKVKVIVVKIFPGMDHKYLENIKRNKIQGIVFETYGTGHAPITDEILKNIRELAEKGVIMVSVSQNSGIEEHPETDLRLLEAGVLNGGNMTTYAAFAKLYYLLSNVKERKAIGQLVEINFRGEMDNQR